MIYGASLTPEGSIVQKSVQWLHTSMQPLHTFFDDALLLRTFVLQNAQIIINMTKAELEKKRDLARTLYLSGKEQAEIAEITGVSRVTISKWCTADGWKAIRAAKTITRPELIKKLLLVASTLLDKVNESGDLALIDSLGDKLSKLTAAIDKLDKSQANVVAAIEVFTAFSKYLEFHAKTDPDVTLEFIKKVNKLQDGFLIESFNQGALVYHGD